MKRGVIVGRFQNQTLHEGYIFFFQSVLSQVDELLVLVGDSEVKNSKRNPLDFPTRKLMITDFLCRQPKYFIVDVIRDMGSDTKWSSQLDSILAKHNYNPDETTLFGSRDSFIPHYTGIHKTVELGHLPEINSTDFRVSIKEPIDSVDFRRGMIYAANIAYPKVWATIDVIVTSFFLKRRHILFGKKRGSEYLVLVGGFSDPTDNSFEESAVRELQEETCLVVDKLTPLFSMKIDDFRYRKEIDKIITNVFHCELPKERVSEARPNDDLIELVWVAEEELDNFNIFSSHKQILNRFLNK